MAWKGWLTGAIAVMAMLGGCASDPTPAEKVAAPFAPPNGPPIPIAVGDFTNRSKITGSATAGGNDPLPAKARSMLQAQMRESQRFAITERDTQSAVARLDRSSGREFRLQTAEYKLTGEIIEIGRREVTTGMFGGGRAQMAYAAVTIYVLNNQAKDPVFGVRGFAEKETTATGPDTAQVDQLLEQAIREAVKDLIEAKDRMKWAQEMR